MKQLPVEKCQYCGSRQFAVGWQHQEAVVTFKKSGIRGSRLKHLICAQCGSVVHSCVAEPGRYPPAQEAW